MNDEANEVIRKLFDSFKNRLESIKGTEFVFDYVRLLHYRCHK